jgi:hypothetical protein
LLLLSFLLVLIAPLSGQIVARVGDYKITNTQLSQEIEFISRKNEYSGLTFLERREIALDNLINEQLLYLYALENNIEVTVHEVEQYFIAQFGNLPKFTAEDGFFDWQRFQELKKTPEVRTIMNELQRELLIIKTETILKNSFRFSDHVLLESFVLENTDIDISYTVINGEDVNIPLFLHPFEAYEYYHANRDRFPTPEYYQVEFFLLPFHDFENQVTVSDEEISDYYTTIDSLSTPLKEEIRETIHQEKLKSLALKEALYLRENLVAGNSIELDILKTTLYSSHFPELNLSCIFSKYDILSEVENIEPREYSQPLETSYGYLVFRVIEQGQTDSSLIYPVARKIWQDFTKDRLISRYNQEYREYYRNNLNDFIVPAVHVTSLTIDLKEIRVDEKITGEQLRTFFDQNRHLFSAEELREDFYGLEYRVREKYFQHKITELKQWIEENIFFLGYDLLPDEERLLENKITVANQVVFLAKLPNKNRVGQKISSQLSAKAFPDRDKETVDDFNNDDEIFDRGFRNIRFQADNITDDRFVIYYRINSYFPAYLPGYEDVEPFLTERFDFEENKRETDYQEYYEQHLNTFAVPDSVQLTGIYIPVKTDTLTISEEELRQYYISNSERFLTEPEAVIEYIFLPDPDLRYRELIGNIYSWVDDKISLSLLQFCYGSEQDIPQNRSFTYSSLPEFLNNLIQNIPVNQTEGPVYYNQGWYIIRKTREIPPKKMSFDEVKNELRRELLRKEADLIAYDKARQIFIEVNSIDDLKAYEDTLAVFNTEKKGVDKEFHPLGDISLYAPRILNLRRNEKLNTLYKNDKGYGVIFLLSKETNNHLPYEESIPLIKKMIAEERRSINARNYIRQLRDLIISDADPDSLLFFFGGWIRENNLTYNSIIPKIPYSKLIVEDAVKRDVGEISHVINLGDENYTFYRVERKKVVGREAFQFVRDDYREQITAHEFKDWLNQYKKTKLIEKY